MASASTGIHDEWTGNEDICPGPSRQSRESVSTAFLSAVIRIELDSCTAKGINGWWGEA